MSNWKETRLDTGYQPGPPERETWADVAKRALEICAQTGHGFLISDDRVEDVRALAEESGMVVERSTAIMFRVSKADDVCVPDVAATQQPP